MPRYRKACEIFYLNVPIFSSDFADRNTLTFSMQSVSRGMVM